MAFDAGAIEARLTIDRSPFDRGLDEAEARAARVSGKEVEVSVGADTAVADAKMAETGHKADELGRKRETVTVRANTSHANEGLGLLTTAILGLAPLVPAVLAPVAGGAAAIGTAFAAAGVGAAGFGAIALPMFKDVIKAQQQLQQAERQYASATTKSGRAAALAREQQATAHLTSSERQLLEQLNKLEATWHRVRNQLERPVGQAITPWLGVLRQGLSYLPLIVRPAAQSIQYLGQYARTAFAAPFWRQFFAWLGATGAISLEAFGHSLLNLVHGFASLMMAFGPLLTQMLPGIVHMTAAFSAWAAHLGTTSAFHQFITYVTVNGPRLLDVFRNLLLIVLHLGQGLMPTGQVMLFLLDVTTRWLSHLNPTLLGVIAESIGAIAVAMKVYAAAQFLASNAVVRWIAVNVIARAATAAWTAAQWLLNAAMDANPIGIVIVAIAALVAGIIYAWTHFRTFRVIVEAAWHGIQVATLAVVNFVRDHWRGLVTILLVILTGGLGALVFQFIIHFNRIKRIVSDLRQWIYDDFVKKIVSFFTETVPRAFSRFVSLANSNLVQPVRRILTDLRQWIWNDFILKVANFFGQTLPSRIGDAVRTIGRIWTGVQNAFKTPVNWVIQHVINGLIGAFDWVTSHVGLGRPIAKLPALAGGGVVPGGYGGGDRQLIAAEPGELVVPKHHVGGLAWLWRMLGIPGYQGGGRVGGARVGDPGVQPGGGDIAGVISGIGDTITGVFKKAYDIGRITAAIATGNTTAMINALSAMFPHGVGGAGADLARLLTRMPVVLVQDAVKYLIHQFASIAGAGGAGSSRSAQAWAPVILQALRMLGQSPAALPAVEHRLAQESGGNPRAVNLWDSNAKAGHPSVGLMQVIAGTFASYAGPFRGTGPFMYGVSINPLANIFAGLHYALARYPNLIAAMLQPGGYDNGGWLGPPVNATGQPEAVLTPVESRAYVEFAKLARQLMSQGNQPGQRDRMTPLLEKLPERLAAVLVDALYDALNGVARGAAYRSLYGTTR